MEFIFRGAAAEIEGRSPGTTQLRAGAPRRNRRARREYRSAGETHPCIIQFASKNGKKRRGRSLFGSRADQWEASVFHFRAQEMNREFAHQR